MTLAFGINLHRIAGVQCGHGRIECAFVLLHLAGMILLAVNRQATERSEHRSDQ
jgi:hypothetical protein